MVMNPVKSSRFWLLILFLCVAAVGGYGVLDWPHNVAVAQDPDGDEDDPEEEEEEPDPETVTVIGSDPTPSDGLSVIAGVHSIRCGNSGQTNCTPLNGTLSALDGPNHLPPWSGPAPPPAPGKPGDGPWLITTGSSIIDNLQLNYIHDTTDYRDAAGSSSCSSCSGGFGGGSGSRAGFTLGRIHRYRDLGRVSSFGPCVFSNLDIKLHCYANDDGETWAIYGIDVFSPHALYARWAQGEGGSGYVDSGHSFKEIRVLDAGGQPQPDPLLAVTAELHMHDGTKYSFEFIKASTVYDVWDARLTRVEDTNGYGVAITYKNWTPEEITESPERQWQIDTVTGVHGQTATFHYHAEQQSGLWAVSQVDLPNGQSVTYDYTGGKLTAVNHPDGTQSTFVFGFDSQVGYGTLEFFDASADPTHRKKTVYYSAVAQGDPNGEVFTQALCHVRMVVNGDNELAYMSFADNSETLHVYEGGGRLRQDENCFEEGWTIRIVTNAEEEEEEGTTVIGQTESTSPSNSYGPTSPMGQGAPIQTSDSRGVVRNYTYDDDLSVTGISYADGTSEAYELNDLKRVTRYKDREGNITRCTYARGNIFTLEVGLTEDSGGSGACTECSETGQIVCSACYGDGYCYECPECLGDGCETCDWWGYPVCEYCEGDGCESCDYTGCAPCTTCGGNGYVTCTACGGTGGGTGGGGEVQQPEYALYQWEYYPEGNVNQFLLSAAIDANGNRTDYEYLTDGVGLDADFAQHLADLGLGVDSDGSARLTTSPEGRRTLSVSDGLGRNVRTMQLDSTGAALTSNTTTHDTMVAVAGYGDCLETSVANALGHTNRRRTDGEGRTIQAVDAENFITQFTFDGNGNRLSLRDPNNVGEDCSYNERDQRVDCADTQEQIENVNRQWVYDSQGNVIQQIDAKGNATLSAYDARNRRTSTTDRLGGVTAFAYDQNGNQLSLTDAENQTTSYDTVNRKVKETYPDHVPGTQAGDQDYSIREFAYDAAGRLSVATDQLGDYITHIYDLANRRTAREYRERTKQPTDLPNDSDTFTFDGEGKILTAGKGRYNNMVTFAHDEAGRLEGESLAIDGNTYTVTHSFDQAGRQVSTTYPDGSIVSRTFTNRSQLQQVDYDGDGPGGAPASSVASFQYDPGHRETQRTHGNGIITNRTYTRSDSLVTSINVPGYPGLSFAYTYDENKNVTSETTGGVMSGYSFTASYDNEGRLASWNRNNGDAQSWTLAPVDDWQEFTDNGTVQTRTHGPTHELTAIDSQPLTYDAKGNLLSTQDSGLTTLYTWDMDNILDSATIPAGSSKGIEGTHMYEYDTLGRRVAKVVNDIGAGTSTRTVFVCTTQPIQYSPYAGQVLAEYESLNGAASTLARKYGYGMYIDEPLTLVDRTSSGSLPAATDEVFYYHQNRLYCVTALIDDTGSVTERHAYSPYGTPTILASDGTTELPFSPVSNSYRFTGRRHDVDTGLHYFRARFYSSELGRFAGRDALEYADGLSLYRAYFSPSATDPTGLGLTDWLVNAGTTEFVLPVGPTIPCSIVVSATVHELDGDGCRPVDVTLGGSCSVKGAIANRLGQLPVVGRQVEELVDRLPGDISAQIWGAVSGRICCGCSEICDVSLNGAFTFGEGRRGGATDIVVVADRV